MQSGLQLTILDCHLIAKHGDAAVNFDFASLNQLVRLAARADSGVGEIFVDAHGSLINSIRRHCATPLLFECDERFGAVDARGFGSGWICHLNCFCTVKMSKPCF